MYTEDKLSLKNKIRVVVVTSNNDIIEKTKSANIFSCVEIADTISEAIEILKLNSVLIVDDSTMTSQCEEIHNAVICVTEKELDISEDSYLSKIPYNMFLNDHLGEFILWACLKAKDLDEKNKEIKNREEMEKMILELQSISRMSVMNNKTI